MISRDGWIRTNDLLTLRRTDATVLHPVDKNEQKNPPYVRLGEIVDLDVDDHTEISPAIGGCGMGANGRTGVNM